MIAIIISVIIVLLYFYGTRTFNYWKKRGVKHDKPIPFFGNNVSQFFQMKSIANTYEEHYKKYPDEKMIGFFISTTPALILRDPDLIKTVLTSDFPYFYPRGVLTSGDAIEPILKNLFFADGDAWKLIRHRITPAYTSGKLKAMFPLIVERAEKLQNIAEDAASFEQEIDVRDLMARYTTDFIGACGFGIDSNSLNDEDSVFRKLGKRLFTITKRDALIYLCKNIFPNLLKHVPYLETEVQNSIVSLVKSIMQQRNNKPSGRNDFIDLLLELKDKGKLIGESIEKRNPDGTPQMVELEMDDLFMASQVLIFFAAGFETSSSATSFTLHQLAFNPEVQRKCQREIDNVLRNHNNKLCYDAIKEMKYLEMTFLEGLRMFPSLGYLSRKCAKQYTFPDTNLTIDAGTRIIIPLQALHNDEKYFDNPKEFRPERFETQSYKNINKYIYLPFGTGPRACIGERLGRMQSLAGLAALLHKFTVQPSKRSQRIITACPTSTITQNIKGGVPLDLVSRKKVL